MEDAGKEEGVSDPDSRNHPGKTQPVSFPWVSPGKEKDEFSQSPERGI
jgi:hypothetical protein